MELALQKWHEAPLDFIKSWQSFFRVPSSSGPADDAQFQGEVVRATPRAVRMQDVDFWRVDTVVMRADEGLDLPIYVVERLFESDWRPHVGQYVCGTLWQQPHAMRRLDGPAQGVQE